MNKINKIKILELSKFDIENDGHVDFFWAGEVESFAITGCEGDYLELRLGYPEKDDLKILSLSGDIIEGGNKTFNIRQGWNSYFVRLSQVPPTGSSITMTVSHSLQVPDDSRFLGVMVSYIGIIQDNGLVQEHELVERMLDAAVAKMDELDSIREWSDWINGLVLNDQDDFYAKTALPLPENVDSDSDLFRFDVKHKRENWLKKHIAPKSKVLEIGTGHGSLAFLKDELQVEIHGIDLSYENAKKAKISGYDETYVASADNMSFATDNTYDYVVSFDVMGHIHPSNKDSVYSEIRRVLRHNGLSIHGIETDDFIAEKMQLRDYSRMVLIDGHIGIQNRCEIVKQFSEYFKIVEHFMLGNTFMSVQHWLRAHYFYGLNLPAGFLEYLINLSNDAEKAFDMGVGWTFNKLISEGYDSKSIGGMTFIVGQNKKVI